MQEQQKTQLHLVRHGEVHNPEGVLYGRLPRFALSERGHEMAALAAANLAGRGRSVAAVYASPLLRAQQSALPIAQLFGQETKTLSALIEPYNKFEGMPSRGVQAAFNDPRHWLKLWNPLLPSWGEPYERIARRVTRAMNEAAAEIEHGDIIMVSHQAVIWAAHRKINGLPLPHNPAKRRCELSSITSFELQQNGSWQEIGYVSPASGLLEASLDRGAV